MILDELRKEIDAVDEQLVLLFLKRMEIAGRIGDLKAQGKSPVLDSAREAEKMNAVLTGVPDEMQGYVGQLYQELFRLSRSYQERTQGGEAWDLTNDEANKAWDLAIDEANKAWDLAIDEANKAWDSTNDEVNKAWTLTNDEAKHEQGGASMPEILRDREKVSFEKDPLIIRQGGLDQGKAMTDRLIQGEEVQKAKLNMIYRKNILVINGPNMNLLGVREPEIYGNRDYAALVEYIKAAAEDLAVRVDFFQSNHEGDIVDAIQGALGSYHGIVINPAAYTHTSLAIADAIAAVGIPAVEVHISDVNNREDFRRISYVREVCADTISGSGFAGYRRALELLVKA